MKSKGATGSNGNSSPSHPPYLSTEEFEKILGDPEKVVTAISINDLPQQEQSGVKKKQANGGTGLNSSSTKLPRTSQIMESISNHINSVAEISQNIRVTRGGSKVSSGWNTTKQTVSVDTKSTPANAPKTSTNGNTTKESGSDKRAQKVPKFDASELSVDTLAAYIEGSDQENKEKAAKKTKNSKKKNKKQQDQASVTKMSSEVTRGASSSPVVTAKSNNNNNNSSNTKANGKKRTQQPQPNDSLAMGKWSEPSEVVKLPSVSVTERRKEVTKGSSKEKNTEATKGGVSTGGSGCYIIFSLTN